MNSKVSRAGWLAAGAIAMGLVPSTVTDAAPPTAPPGAQATPELIAAPVEGVAAIDALGSDLPAAAAVNEMSVKALTELVLEDDSVLVDKNGRIVFVDPAPGAAELMAAAEVAAAAPFPYAQTFLLHSRPGAQRTIYLDFDGAVVSGTAWNSSFGLGSNQGPFDLDGTPGSFSNAEHDAIQSIWQAVSEDFAPFNIDVTTQVPAAGVITRTNSADQIYGTVVLLTSDTLASSAVCASSCGGIAYYDAFDNSVDHTYYQPAFVFPHLLSNQAKPIAEAASHEAGHNLGLHHDGSGYYGGHGSWAPIMGNSYYRPVSQWSIGQYTGADNVEDDLAVIQSHGGTLMIDDHGDTAAAATALNGTGPLTGSGLISTRADKDVFSFTTTCGGLGEFTVEPATTSPNLDVRVRVLSSTGAQLASADPPVATAASDMATGLASSATVTLAAGSYRIEVDGVGFGDPLNSGYSDYGSLGRYTVSASVCGGLAQSGLPGVPTGFGLTKNDAARTATMTWTPPASDGGSPITGYRVSRSAFDTHPAYSTTVSAAARSQTMQNLRIGGTYTLSVEAINANGIGPAASGPVTINAVATAPGAPVIGTATAGSFGGAITARAAWSAPASTGGSPITGYVVRALRMSSSGTVLSTTTSAVQSAAARSLSMTLPRTGNYRFTVQAINGVGAGPQSARSNQVAGR